MRRGAGTSCAPSRWPRSTDGWRLIAGCGLIGSTAWMRYWMRYEKRRNTVREIKVIAEPGTQEAAIVRDFDAPRELVFKVYTDPDLMAQWLGPRRLAMVIDRMEVKPGGAWRYIHREDDGM